MKSRHKLLFTILGGLLISTGIVTESGLNIGTTKSFVAKTSALNNSNDSKGAVTITSFELKDGNKFWLKTFGTDYPDVDGQGNFWFNPSQALQVMDNLYTNLLFYDLNNQVISYSLTANQAVGIDMWTSHPYLNIVPAFDGGKTIEDVKKVEIKADLKIPSYEYYQSLSTTPAPSYYTIKVNYIATRPASGDVWDLTFDQVVVSNVINNIHVRNDGPVDEYGSLHMLFIFNDSDYGDAPSAYSGDVSFLNNITVFTNNYKKFTLAELYNNDIKFRLWEANAINIAIKGTAEVNGNTIEYVSIGNNCNFPSKSGVDLYDVGEHGLYNEGVGTANPGFAVSFTVKDNCHTITYKNNEDVVIGYQMAPANTQVKLMTNPLPDVEGKAKVWRLDNDVFNGIMANNDITLKADYFAPENIDTELKNSSIPESSVHYIQIRDGSGDQSAHDALYMLFLLENNDYTVANTPYTGDKSFTEKIVVHTLKGDYTLNNLLRSGNPTFRLWNEADSLAFPINGQTVDATIIDSVEILPNCVFPSMSGDRTYTLASHEYFNQAKNLPGWSVTFVKAENPCHKISIVDLQGGKSYARGEEGKEVVLPELGKGTIGYTTAYLSDEVEIYNGNKFTMTNTDVTVTAELVPISYKITYVGLDGCDTITNPESYTIESDKITLKNPTKTGFDFIGWVGGNYSEPTKEAVIEKGSYGDITFTAKFEIKKCEVTFNSSGGTEVPSQTVEFNKTINKPNDPTKEGFTFLGWYKDEALTELYDFSSPVIGNLTLYAKFATTVTVHFDSAGGSAFSDIIIEKGKSLPEPTVTPTRKGYKFNGWYNGNEKWDFSKTIDQDITLTAHWQNAGGCGGSVVVTSSILSTALLTFGLLLIVRKVKSKEEK